MSEEPKDVRLPLMVSATEARAIDDWRFANRISTRAEAIRRLIQAGIAAEPILADLLRWLETDTNPDRDTKRVIKQLQIALGRKP